MNSAARDEKLFQIWPEIKKSGHPWSKYSYFRDTLSVTTNCEGNSFFNLPISLKIAVFLFEGPNFPGTLIPQVAMEPLINIAITIICKNALMLAWLCLAIPGLALSSNPWLGFI